MSEFIKNEQLKFSQQIDLEATGNNKITKIEIKNEDVLEDAEMLSDIVLVAVNNVLDQIKKEHK